MPTMLVPALLVVAMAAARVAAPTPVEYSMTAGVRPLSRGLAALLEEGLDRSSLMRSQLAVLEASDLVVYLKEVCQSQAGEPKGKLQFLSAVAGRRYVVISLDVWNLSRYQRLVLLAHELQHAVEVARAPAVTDLAGFEALYRRIGLELRDKHFETVAACQAAARMRADLCLSPVAAGVHGRD